MPELLSALDRHRAAAADGRGVEARMARAETQVWAIVADRLRARLHDPAHARSTAAVLDEVARHQLDPFAAADRLLSDIEAD